MRTKYALVATAALPGQNSGRLVLFSLGADRHCPRHRRRPQDHDFTMTGSNSIGIDITRAS
jgi:hypothetical protein